MAGTASEEFGVGRSLEEISNAQQQAISEWRSTEHLEIGSPSTSPPYWDSDDEDDNGPKPAELYGKYTWKIDKFSQINKRELRSNPFEVGGYKWYILIYPQGCDVCNHLSLFLCVANHDKLLPGWSHFAQFTIAVVNKDPKKSKYSDTLHRFWKKEHDWGWKKFMELSKVLDGFIDADTLIIKAQVQVIRERADRPFRCLDCNYRRELIRVYLTNVEQICRRFVEERRGKLGKLIEDKGRWTSFCTFWLGMDQTSRRAMSWEKTDSILKVIAKHFFIEKEVTSTLVMDSLYSGMKALEGQSDKSKGKHVDLEESPAPIVRMEKDMFVLVDDVLLLLERAALEPLPPKDEKGPQNRIKEGSSGDEFNKDSVERDERRLTELGRRTIEIFVLAHIFSKIEVAYQEAVALRRQEELIREEEAAWLAESEQKNRRGADKEKKSKKKQAKQKRNNRKSKDKSKDEKPVIVPVEHETPNDDSKNFLTEEPDGSTEKVDVAEDISDVSDSIDCIPEVQHPDAGDQNLVYGDWDTETLDLQPPVEASSPLAVPNGPVGEMSATSAVDDSSSTCSTDSIPSVVNGINKGKRTPSYFKKQKSPNRRHERGKSMEADWSGGYHNQPSESSVSALGSLNEMSRSSKKADTICSLEENQTKGSNQPELKKVEEIVSSGTILGIKIEKEVERLSVEMTLTLPTQPVIPPRNSSSLPELKAERKNSSNSGKSASVGRLSDIEKPVDESSHVRHPVEVTVMSKSGTGKPTSADLLEKPSTQHVPVSAGKPVSHQVPEPSTQHHVPVSAGKPVSHQVPEPSTQQHVLVSAGKPVSHQAPVFTEKPSAQPVPVSAEKVSTQKVAVVSRPLSSNLVPGSSRPTTPTTGISMVQTPQPPLLSRSSSSAGWSNPETSSTATSSYSYVPQSYRNVMMGNTLTVSSVGFAQSSHQISHSPALVSKPLFTTSQSPERVEVNAIKSSFSPFGMVKQDNMMMPDGRHWIETTPQIEDDLLSSNELRNIDIYKQMQQQQHSIPHYLLPPEYAAVGTSGRVNHGLGDEFPHMGIINDLLEDDAVGKTGVMGSSFHTYSNGGQHFHRQFSLPNDTGGLSTDIGPSTSSSCRFERTLSYHDGLHHHAYASPYETLRDMAAPPPQPSYRPYAANGHHHMDMLPNQWHMGGGGGGSNERPYLNTRDMNNDGFPPYHHNHAEYINMAASCGRINFSGFHPSSNGN